MRPQAKHKTSHRAGGPRGMGIGFGSGSEPKPALPARKSEPNPFAARRRPKAEPQPIDIQKLSAMRVVAREEAARLSRIEQSEYQIGRMRDLLHERLTPIQIKVLNHAIRMGKFDAPTLYFVFKTKAERDAVGMLARRMRE